MTKSVFAALVAVGALFTSFPASAAEPGWVNRVIAPPEVREQLRATPIEQRPYRPLHFYGNTVRRIHYRGTPLPRPAETVAVPVRVLVPR